MSSFPVCVAAARRRYSSILLYLTCFGAVAGSVSNNFNLTVGITCQDVFSATFVPLCHTASTSRHLLTLVEFFIQCARHDNDSAATANQRDCKSRLFPRKHGKSCNKFEPVGFHGRRSRWHGRLLGIGTLCCKVIHGTRRQLLFIVLLVRFDCTCQLSLLHHVASS